MLDSLLRAIKKIVPKSVFGAFQPLYHYTLAFIAALVYRFPGKKIMVVGITGTKGKTTVAELVNVILETAGHSTALSSTLRFKIGNKSERNMYKMTMPGRFFVQKFLRDAVNAHCKYAILEMTSEGAKQFRHKWVYPDALIFTNLAPEHIESHGSFENYRDAKLSIAEAVVHSGKKKTILVTNDDDPASALFRTLPFSDIRGYSLKDAGAYVLEKDDARFTYQGLTLTSRLPGTFNILNTLAAARFAETQGITPEKIKKGIESLKEVRGRAEHVNEGQGFRVIVDYAHTPDSLEKIYQAFSYAPIIAVLGNTGGGRDTWKRPAMGAIAEKYCRHVILTNEDPYDEDPRAIVNAMAAGMKEKTPHIIMDRRDAIAAALREATTGDVVLITGKGTDPYIMQANSKKIPWDDATVVREELRKLPHG